jgi:hypothetical protein
MLLAREVMDSLRLPFFDEISDARTILLAGAGGGYDIFTGLPLYFGLLAQGKQVHLANLSFSTLYATDGRRIGKSVVEVTAETQGGGRYFPEGHLARWFARRGDEVPIFCIDRAGVAPTVQAYRDLNDLLQPDTVILIDGGTDSLMRGDEAGLGTPQEDVASIAAVDALDVAHKILVCLGFGVDTFHGVCHAQFLEAVADLIRDNGFLGAWTVTREMPEAQLYREAAEFVHAAMPHHPSIVSSSILSAIDGRFGDYHQTRRTEGSELFINPLMSLYWSFQVEAVARRNLYLDLVRDTQSFEDLTHAIAAFRARSDIKDWQVLPM